MERIQYRPRRGLRKEKRFAVDIQSMIAWEGIYEPVTIKNISSYGALLQGRSFPPINSRITIITEGLEVCGTVIWLGADQCGVLLLAPVEPLELLRERRVRAAPPASAQPITLQKIGPASYA